MIPDPNVATYSIRNAANGGTIVTHYGSDTYATQVIFAGTLRECLEHVEKLLTKPEPPKACNCGAA